MTHVAGSAPSTTAPLEGFPHGAVPLAKIVLTEELHRRPSRAPDYETENRALTSLARALGDSPSTILQVLADKALEVLQADSAGLSLLTKDETRFYWAAISGAWGPHVGGGTPRDFGPCGDVLNRNAPMLFTHWERRYPYLGAAVPLADEGLLVPFHVNGKAVGTIWVIAHDQRRRFDTEDLRLLESMGRFASAAYQSVQSIESLTLEIAARASAESTVRELANGLETQVRARTQELERSTQDLLAANKELEREIAERQRAEEERRVSELALAKLRSELAHMGRVSSLGAMTASIAHEVNQPLSGILTNANTCVRMLRADPPNVEGALETARRTIRDSERASSVITRLRALFAKKEPVMEPVCLNEAAREVIALAASELDRNHAVLRVELADDLPPINGDRIQLQQVILNLLLNGSEAMSAIDGCPRHLVISTARDGVDRVQLAVQDVGVGFDSRVVDALFEPFYTTKPGGMGIGLSVSRSIIESHGGRLSATLNEGPGATFAFSIPTDTKA